VLFGRDPAPGAAAAARIAAELLADCGLAAQAGRPAATLTLSARKRLEVARALGTGPRLLMLDEVMAGLTPTEVAEMIEALRRLKDRYGLTILIIEHVMRALTVLSDRITVLHHGRRIAEGTPAEIGADRRVTDAYFGAADDDAETAAETGAAR
jgi:branched-chain amino acid transport system ATP-binding protein